MEEGGDNDGGNSDSSIFAELATQYRSDILRHLGRMDEKGSIVGNLCRLKLNRILFWEFWIDRINYCKAKYRIPFYG